LWENSVEVLGNLLFRGKNLKSCLKKGATKVASETIFAPAKRGIKTAGSIDFKCFNVK
jgi:hypothetical protein